MLQHIIYIFTDTTVRSSHKHSPITTMAGDKDTTSQTFDFETMAIVVYVMQKNNITMGKEVFKMMSAADGKRGPDGFQHQFRNVKKRATEIAEEVAGGNSGTPVLKTKVKASGSGKAGTPAKEGAKGVKRGTFC